jgi:hypothetical protein
MVLFCLAQSETASPPGDHRDLVRLHQLLGVLDRLRGLALVVAEQHLDLATEHASLGVDLLDGHLDAGAVRAREGGADAAVGVDVADLDRRLGRGGACSEREQQGGRREGQETWCAHAKPPPWIDRAAPE